jgi:hypothetical protein
MSNRRRQHHDRRNRKQEVSSAPSSAPPAQSVLSRGKAPDQPPHSRNPDSKNGGGDQGTSASNQATPPPPQQQQHHHHQHQHQHQQPVGRNTYLFTRTVFLHLLGLIYFTAFLVAWHQNEGLIGPSGLTPANTYMQRLVSANAAATAAASAAAAASENKDGLTAGDSLWTAVAGFREHPTLLWFVDVAYASEALDVVTLAGAALSAVLMVVGRANALLLLALWLLYFSIDTVGQRWYGFGWESQLLETGFLAIFSCPLVSFSSLRGSPPLAVVAWGYRWLMFRLMVGAGLIKLRGDQCWRDLTCVLERLYVQLVGVAWRWFCGTAGTLA